MVLVGMSAAVLCLSRTLGSLAETLPFKGFTQQHCRPCWTRSPTISGLCMIAIRVVEIDRDCWIGHGPLKSDGQVRGLFNSNHVYQGHLRVGIPTGGIRNPPFRWCLRVKRPSDHYQFLAPGSFPHLERSFTQLYCNSTMCVSTLYIFIYLHTNDL